MFAHDDMSDKLRNARLNKGLPFEKAVIALLERGIVVSVYSYKVAMSVYGRFGGFVECRVRRYWVAGNSKKKMYANVYELRPREGRSLRARMAERLDVSQSDVGLRVEALPN